jgi:hypothetical protein
MSRRNLQLLMMLLAPIPLITGVLTMLGVDDPLYAGLGLNLPRDPTFDSNLRFLGGVWCGLGFAALWTIPRIDSETSLFRCIWGAIFLGGVGRAVSLALVGAPLLPFIGFALLEIVGAPLLVLWQAKLRRASP